MKTTNDAEWAALDVSAMARVLSDRSADACNIDRDDNWAMYGHEFIEDVQAMLAAAPATPAAQGAVPDSVTALPDGSAFAVFSYQLPDSHWIYAEREYEGDAVEPKELPRPILTHALRDEVVAAVRYAIRGATNCGKEPDFDPDALVQNAVYALCGPYTAAPAQPAVQEDYPECDYCGVAPDHHPWHGSGILNGAESCHIHACDSCRHLLPAVQNQGEVQRLREALEECAASLAWNCFGECRAIHAGPIMPAAQALETARAALAASTGQGVA